MVCAPCLQGEGACNLMMVTHFVKEKITPEGRVMYLVRYETRASFARQMRAIYGTCQTHRKCGSNTHAHTHQQPILPANSHTQPGDFMLPPILVYYVPPLLRGPS